MLAGLGMNRRREDLIAYYCYAKFITLGHVHLEDHWTEPYSIKIAKIASIHALRKTVERRALLVEAREGGTLANNTTLMATIKG